VAGDGKKKVDQALALALAAGRSPADAAKAVQVSERTVYRRLQDVTFVRHVAQFRTRMVGQTVGRLSKAGTLAVRVLCTLARKATSEAVRLSAARSLLEFMFHADERYTLAQRFEELRLKMAALEHAPPPWDGAAGFSPESRSGEAVRPPAPDAGGDDDQDGGGGLLSDDVPCLDLPADSEL
jgi:hypothetical protein